MALTGLAADHDSLPQAAPDWPDWQWEWSPSAPAEGSGWSRRRLSEHPEQWICVDLEHRRLRLVTPDRPSDAALLHPWLTTAAAIVKHAEGHDTFHAAGIVIGDRVWAFMGEKEVGKTSTAARLVQRGLVTTGDDLVVLQGGIVLSGPAAIDLREQAAMSLGAGSPVELLPGRLRWRMWGAPAPAEVPFAGFLLPRWGDAHELMGVAPMERIEQLVRHSYVQDSLGRESRLLELAALPFLHWSRPRRFEALDTSLTLLLEALGPGLSD